MMVKFLVALSLFFLGCAHGITPPSGEMERLLKEADTDGDKKITVLDETTLFVLQSGHGREVEVAGTYYLSNLLQELKLASLEQRSTIDRARIFENPVARISRSIRERYWDNLVRRVDLPHLQQVLEDSKLAGQKQRHLYVPSGDPQALAYFKAAEQNASVKVWQVPAPEKIDIPYMRSIRKRHGLLSLALKKHNGELRGVPFVVPGGRFNEMYGWDSYFEALGLIEDGRVDLAKAMVDNFVYQIEHYGKILNANRSYYLNRSQPPFLTAMISAVYQALEKNPAREMWLNRAVQAAIKEYETVWQNSDRRTPIGLNRYFGNGHGIPPEVEPGHFDFVLQPAARRHGLTVKQLQERYNSGQLRDKNLDEFFAHDRAVRESGHDTTYRWRVNGKDRAADFVTVDLNSLLYKFETDLAHFTGDKAWTEKAERRKALMMRYLWDPEREMFFDYNFKDQQRSTFVSATGFYPLWAGLVDARTAKITVRALLQQLEAPGGLLSTDLASLIPVQIAGHARQWDYPNGWAPHQMLAWQGLKNYGENEVRQRLIYKWLFMITKNAADFNGTIPEKFDVVKRSHAVFAEYGNVGTDFAYITQEGFGWMNASYQVGLRELPAELKSQLENLTPPEKLF